MRLKLVTLLLISEWWLAGRGDLFSLLTQCPDMAILWLPTMQRQKRDFGARWIGTLFHQLP